MSADAIVCTHRAISHLLSYLRDVKTNDAEFACYAKRLMNILAEEALCFLDHINVDIITPTNIPLKNVERIDVSNVCAVSVLRSGDALLQSFTNLVPTLAVGKILIQRDESSEEKNAVLFYSKLPAMISKMKIILCDPMLATGGSSVMAVEVLLEKGCQAKNIIFANLISCPEGIAKLKSKYEDVTIVTCVIDEGLNEDKYIVPGLGDFGDRFYHSN
mmetsp:Transcript_6444/g.9670  ORF Transcript_6444/g.9670 Transcript_6444/m.9670 type:complete len:217 (-) Transcript_6444:28-678(-)